MKWWTEVMDAHARPADLGILYAEDFGNERQKATPAAKPAPQPSPPPITQADIDTACIRAVQAAEHAWSTGAEERRAGALSALAAGLTEARQEAARHAETVADNIAQTALSLLAGALPHFCRNHGDEEVRALMARLIPFLAPSTQLVVRVHPALIETLAADIAALDDGLTAQIELRSANLPPGDVRLSWEDGRLTRDSSAICTALQDGLAALGLINPDLTEPGLIEPSLTAPRNLPSQTRSFELAQ